ncbi:tRNA (cytidine(34)-2'-O)-methyltransferase [Telmatospirillum sp.]|uniref:tRNA (cytidine(34)-2'-O)-methyltransferase n=1 Tax=Telmatospirillum sp. TaxID=2079197 RepID=UPI00283D0C7C|nr:tRNA (cytidine(34)-2'-O)-methyltransferase [Telmatospirillum sp.]MDR3438498.1 tRNA (cytidine(34)-2'-O)-methyltransferase [Telmatospirillum sp.]
MRIVLYQPDIPQNTGAILRLAACFDVPVDIIEPCGFLWDDRRLRRAGMDYLELANCHRHLSWTAFQENRTPGRLVLLTTRGATLLHSFVFSPTDVLLFGRESAGVPDAVHDAADERVRIAMAPAARSLNVAMTAAIVVAEALRQTAGFPAPLEGD